MYFFNKNFNDIDINFTGRGKTIATENQQIVIVWTTDSGYSNITYLIILLTLKYCYFKRIPTTS